MNRVTLKQRGKNNDSALLFVLVTPVQVLDVQVETCTQVQQINKATIEQNGTHNTARCTQVGGNNDLEIEQTGGWKNSVKFRQIQRRKQVVGPSSAWLPIQEAHMRTRYCAGVLGLVIAASIGLGQAEESTSLYRQGSSTATPPKATPARQQQHAS